MKGHFAKIRRKIYESNGMYQGSSCHIKGSRVVVERLQELDAENDLGGSVELAGTFCMGKCQEGVCVTVGDKFFSVSPGTVDEFFEKEIKQKVKK